MTLVPGDPSSILFLRVIKDCLNIGLSSVSSRQGVPVENNSCQHFEGDKKSLGHNKAATVSSVGSPGSSPVFLE